MLKIYLGIFLAWLALTAIAVTFRRRRAGRVLLRVSYVVFFIFCIEATCILAFYVRDGRYSFDNRREFLSRLYQPHPYLVTAPRPGAHAEYRGIGYTHNSQGFRGPEIAPKSERLRIVAVGGSTTYGANVTDGREWPVRLGELLGPRYEVLNFGMLGHSTVEHIALMSLIVPEYRPDILIVHVGLNDLRSMHIRNLAPDYSDYHAHSLYTASNFCTMNPAQRFASGKAAILILQRVGLYPDCASSRPVPPADLSKEAEERALALYRRNLETLVAIAAAQGLKPVFLPQILVRERVINNGLRWWIPHVDAPALVDYLARYNDVTEQVAARHHLYFAREILRQPWTAQDFADPSHINAEASLTFAEIVRGIVSKLNETDYRVAKF